MNRFSIAFKLLRKNLKKIIIFEAIYKLFTTAIFTPLLVEMVNLALRLSGINYLTNTRLISFIMKPTTIAILFLLLLLFSIFCLFEMSALSYCYDLSYNDKEASVVNMIKIGFKSAFRLLGNHNFLMIFFILLLIPITHLAVISGYLTSNQIPVFIMEFLKTKKTALLVIAVLYSICAIFVVRWINSINYYTVEKMNFKNARKASVNLNRKKYPGLIISFLIWQFMVLVLLVVSYIIITFLVTKFLVLILNDKTAYNIALFVAREMFSIWSTLYSCIIVPITFAFLCGYFYARKQKIKEEVVVPVIKEKKAMPKNKLVRILSVVVLVSAFLNILYISLDFGIFRGNSNVQLLSKTMIAAHRGYSAEAPENTIPAFEAAIDNFSDYVELDVQETKDGTVIVLHDSNFKRVADVKQNVWNVDYEQIQYLDVGCWFSEEYAGVTVPTLEEVMEMAKGRLKLNIEIKLTGHEKNLEKSVVELIEKYEMEDECVVTSFQKKALKKVKEYNEDIKTGYILHVAYGDFSGVEYVDALSVNYSFATEALINDAHNVGKEVYVWTVNEADAINDMIQKGADMIITDDPVLAKETLTSYETNPYVVKLVKKYMTSK
ncbi:MAG: glycerophosphodiester phosphodiesterase [Lachnospiraceae bacterium]|nr:glycerophosphodiester phosphodiesterase [Lachnospiraceae bacterium]